MHPAGRTTKKPPDWEASKLIYLLAFIIQPFTSINSPFACGYYSMRHPGLCWCSEDQKGPFVILNVVKNLIH